jgi:equilibrative nucleoside transporter 1/2/3
MFLAAAPYFQSRFASSEWLLANFQSAIVTTSSVSSLLFVLLLTKLQRNASYPKRTIVSIALNLGLFTLLALSTVLFRHISAQAYFAFVILMVFGAGLATALCQNGLFAFAAGFGVSEYMHAIMTGQAVAGLLPCIVQIVSVLSVPEDDQSKDTGDESPKSAFIYFLTATAVSGIALVTFVYLAKRHSDHASGKVAINDEDVGITLEESEHVERKVVGMVTLFRKLKWFAIGCFMTFAGTMFYPVFTEEILSVRPAESSSGLFQPACFIPLAFLLWNAGDLVGRMATAIPALNIRQRPWLVFTLSILRLSFLPLYLLCNIRGRGAAIESDVFYLFFVQFLFGVSNGFLGSTCMMAASEWANPEEREATGGFMGLCLMGGLTTGGLLSFLVAA